ncbi:AAA family ATPase [Candidatus Binatia bacterium]|jgi:DNA-binding winged helix-turn-helix (wHTH) protein|nr:AAA family ATPase [Candidatus Binatia bacterium]
MTNRVGDGAVSIDVPRGLLLRDGRPVQLRPKTWAVLLYLAERPGLLVSRDQLLEALWPGVAVTPETVSKSISELRVALGDDDRPARYIETANRRGYRLLVDLLAHRRRPAIAGPSDAALDAASDGGPPLHPLVGRDRELAELASALQRAQAGQPQVRMISGPAGIGKTALVTSFLESTAVRGSAAPLLVVRATCFEQHGPAEPLLPVLQALESLARQSSERDRLVRLTRRAAPMWLAQMPWLTSEQDAEVLQRSLHGLGPQRMPREFAALVEGLAAERTVVLVLEDLHASDPATVDLITLLAQRPAPLRLLVIGNYRPADLAVRDQSLASAVRTMLARPQSVQIPLHDLTVDAARRYLAARFPEHALPDDLPSALHAHTGGQPLFLVSVIDHLVSHGWIVRSASGWVLDRALSSIDLGVPEDVRQLLETQLYQRSPAERALLEAASVVHGEITTRTIAGALGRDASEVEASCEALARAALFLQAAGRVEWPDGSIARRYAFSHDFHRQVVYESIAEERRVRLHHRVGEALEAAWGARAVDIASQLAMHFRRGGDGVRAQRYMIVAGRRARARFATREAIACFASALEAIRSLPDGAARDRAELDIRLELGRALADHEGFATESVRTNYARVTELCATAGSEADLFEALYARWYLHSLRGEPAPTCELAAQLKDLALRLGNAELALADSALVRLALWQGRLADTHEPMAALLAREAELLHAPAGTYGMDPLVAASMHYASTLWLLGETAGARDAASAGIERARASGNPFFLAGALSQGAMVRLFLGEVTEGAGLAEQASRVAAEHEFAFWHAFAGALAGWATVQRGLAAEGAIAIERAAHALQATGTSLFRTCVQAFLAEARLRSGAYAEGLTAVRTGLDIAARSFDCGYAPELWRLRGELLLASDPSDHADGDLALLHALELSRASGAHSLELKAALSLARTWQQRGRVAEARDVLAGVCAWFGERGTCRDVVAARGLLVALSA